MDVARSVGISPAQLNRLETDQRGLYVEDFAAIVEALGEKPGNLLPNDLGDIGYLKPLIDRLASVKPELLGRVAVIIKNVVQLIDDLTPPDTPPPRAARTVPKRKPAPLKKARR